MVEWALDENNRRHCNPIVRPSSALPGVGRTRERPFMSQPTLPSLMWSSTLFGGVL